MTKTHTKSPNTRINISVMANHQLVRESLSYLIDNNNDLTVIATGGYRSDRAELTKFEDSDIVVVYLEPGDPVEIIKDVRQAGSSIRIVAITDGEDLDCSTRALKFGAVGIVRSDQSSKFLIEAIRQAFKGETWLNQTLLTNLIKNGETTNGNRSVSKTQPAPESITPREIEVITMIGKGLKSKVIAQRLNISEATVRHHLSSIYSKLGVDDRLNLVIYAFEKGLITLSDSVVDN